MSVECINYSMYACFIRSSYNLFCSLEFIGFSRGFPFKLFSRNDFCNKLKKITEYWSKFRPQSVLGTCYPTKLDFTCVLGKISHDSNSEMKILQKRGTARLTLPHASAPPSPDTRRAAQLVPCLRAAPCHVSRTAVRRRRTCSLHSGPL